MVANVKKRFEVHPYNGPDVVNGKVKRTVYAFNKETRKMETKLVEQPAGFMVYTSTGNSVRLKDEAELRKHGFGGDPELVDMDTGDIIGPADTSLKAHSERVTKKGKPRDAFEAALQE